MPEILTESFCERCGTRYTFEAAAPKGKRLGKLKVFSKGFVNFVSSDETSLDEALADARSDEQRELTTRQLDAFHQTFQFCLSCRQYTCANCWNESEKRCLSCAPQLGQDVLAAPFPALDAMTGIGFAATPPASTAPIDSNGHGERTAAAWPTTDVAPQASPDSTPDAALDQPALSTGIDALQAVDLVVASPEADASGVIAEEGIDEDVARAVAEAELARLAHERAEAERLEAERLEAERAEAERAHLTQLAAEAEQARNAQAEAEAEAERARLAAAEAEEERARVAAQAEAEQALRTQELAEAEQLRRSVAEAEQALDAQELEEADRLRVTAAADEVERVRLAADLEAELARQARAEVEAERLRQAQADAEWAHAVAEADRLQQIAAEAEAERARQARAKAEAEAERVRQARAEADAEAERARQAAADAAAAAEAERARQAQAEADAEAERARQAVAEAEAERARQAVADAEAERAREAAARAAADAQRPDDRVGPPIWQIIAPEPSAGPEPDPLAVRPAILKPQQPLPARPDANAPATHPAGGGPTWPTSTTPPPQWPMPTAGGAAASTADLWAASSEDVISKPGPTGVQACLSCGLPLSASARFCRRCGTQQR